MERARTLASATLALAFGKVIKQLQKQTVCRMLICCDLLLFVTAVGLPYPTPLLTPASACGIWPFAPNKFHRAGEPSL